MARNKLTPEQRQGMVDDYLSGMTCQEVADRYGVRQCSAWELLKRRGVTRPSHEALRTRSLDRSAFDVLTDEAAYWVGFLITDGCVSPRGTACGSATLCVQIQERDGAHLSALLRHIGSDAPIATRNPVRYAKSFRSGRYSRINVVIPRKMVDALVRYGVTPRKSRTAEAKVVCDSPHFWRGVIDGDGSVMLRKASGLDGYPIISFCSASKRFASQFSGFCQSASPGCKATLKFSRDVWQVAVGGRFAIALTRVLYGGNGPALARKRATAQKILNLADADPLWCLRKNSPENIARLRGLWTPELKARLSAERKGKPVSPQTRAALAASRQDPGWRRRQSEAIKTSPKFRAGIIRSGVSRRRLSEDDAREVVRRHRQGEKARALAAAFGVGRTTIYRVIQRSKSAHANS